MHALKMNRRSFTGQNVTVFFEVLLQTLANYCKAVNIHFNIDYALFFPHDDYQSIALNWSYRWDGLHIEYLVRNSRNQSNTGKFLLQGITKPPIPKDASYRPIDNVFLNAVANAASVVYDVNDGILGNVMTLGVQVTSEEVKEQRTLLIGDCKPQLRKMLMAALEEREQLIFGPETIWPSTTASPLVRFTYSSPTVKPVSSHRAAYDHYGFRNNDYRYNGELLYKSDLLQQLDPGSGRNHEMAVMYFTIPKMTIKRVADHYNLSAGRTSQLIRREVARRVDSLVFIFVHGMEDHQHSAEPLNAALENVKRAESWPQGPCEENLAAINHMAYMRDVFQAIAHP